MAPENLSLENGRLATKPITVIILILVDVSHFVAAGTAA
jgi:hypothetical protein